MVDPVGVVVIVPVLGRPHRVEPLMASVAEATPAPYRLLFVASHNDQTELAALHAVGADFITVPGRFGTWARKVNAGFAHSTEPYLFTGADDLRFHLSWLPNALRRMGGPSGPIGVVGTNDLCNPRTMSGEHSTHSLVSRAYIDAHGTIDEPGKVVHEGYRHDYADDELVATARVRGAYAHALDSIVEHLHPWAGKAPDDATYRLGRRGSAPGRQLFRRRSRLWATP